MSDLPDGWASAPLRDVATSQLGRMLSSARETGDHAKPYLRNRDVQWGRINVDKLPLMDFAGVDAERFTLVPDDLLVCEGGEVGRTAVWNGQLAECYYQKALHRVRTSPALVPLFLRYVMEYYARTRAFERFTSGTTIAHLPQEDLRNLPLPIPPVPEQRRIVGAIEELFTQLDSGVAGLIRVGRLLGTWRSSVLGTHYKLQAQSFGLIPLEQKLGKDALFCDGDWVETKDQDPSGQFRLTQLADIGDGYWRNRSDRYMNQEQFERIGCTRLEVDDVLIARMPDPLGRACLFPDDLMPCATVVDVAIVRPQPGSSDPRWLMWMINSPQVRTQIASLQSGTTRKRISRRNLATVFIPDTPLSEQPNVVKAVDTAATVADRWSASCDEALVRADRLRTAILASAMSGSLSPQDPDDDPASVLLERVASEGTLKVGNKRQRPRGARRQRDTVSL